MFLLSPTWKYLELSLRVLWTLHFEAWLVKSLTTGLSIQSSESHVAQAGLELSIVAKVDLELLTSAPDLSLLGRQVCWALSGRRPPF